MFIQLSRDGLYWNVNSVGIFKKKYSRNKRKVHSVPAVGGGKGTDTIEVISGQTKGATAPAGDSSKTSADKSSKKPTDTQPKEPTERAKLPEGQMDMFAGMPETKEEILTRVNEKYKNADIKEQIKLTREAIESRKKRAVKDSGGGDSDGETKDAVKRDGEPQKVERYDRQGNPIDEKGELIIEEISSVDDITDNDFIKPTRSIALPTLPEEVQRVLSTEGKRVIIKKNILGRNAIRHDELTPEMSRAILKEALYNPTLYGQNKPLSRPNNWIVINVPDGKGNNKLVVLEVNDNKDNIEIVHWYEVDQRGLEKIKRQAEREDGQLLILPSESSEEAGALSGPTSDMPSADKGSKNLTDTQPKEPTDGPKLPEGQMDMFAGRLETALIGTLIPQESLRHPKVEKGRKCITAILRKNSLPRLLKHRRTYNKAAQMRPPA